MARLENGSDFGIRINEVGEALGRVYKNFKLPDLAREEVLKFSQVAIEILKNPFVLKSILGDKRAVEITSPIIDLPFTPSIELRDFWRREEQGAFLLALDPSHMRLSSSEFDNIAKDTEILDIYPSSRSEQPWMLEISPPDYETTHFERPLHPEDLANNRLLFESFVEGLHGLLKPLNPRAQTVTFSVLQDATRVLLTPSNTPQVPK